MILIKKATFDEVPALSLKGWKLYGEPIVEQRVYGSTTDFMGYSHQGTTTVNVYQTMIKDFSLTASEFTTDLYLLCGDGEKKMSEAFFKENKEDVLEYLQSISKQKELFDSVESELGKRGWKVVWKERDGYGYPDLEYKHGTR